MTFELPLFKHVHRLYSRNENTRTAERFHAQHWANDPFDRSMVLLDDVVKIFAVTYFNGRLMIDVVAFDRSGVGTTLVDSDLLGVTCNAIARLRKRRAGPPLDLHAKSGARIPREM